ncbi:MAG TPA: hypothetical protein ENN19_18320 [Chloroflexi bacterium]|nr:hypothetical protein [Chloroflexota bacterium]
MWEQEWVVHSQPVGNGWRADKRHPFKYLAPYIFRVAISNVGVACLVGALNH